MNWGLAIEINRRALLRIVMGLFAMVGTDTVVTRAMRRAVLASLLPAEAAARRLIAIAATGLVEFADDDAVQATGRMPNLPLIDARRDPKPPEPPVASGRGPGVWFLDDLGDVPPEKVAQESISSARLLRRLRALRHALETIPAQAKRLAREQAAMERPLRVMRPGRPPGYRKHGRAPIDVLLADCHELALMALAEVEAADTS